MTLLSTVVAPGFRRGRLVIEPLTEEELELALQGVTQNFCGHPLTDGYLRTLAPDLPAPVRGVLERRK